MAWVVFSNPCKFNTIPKSRIFRELDAYRGVTGNDSKLNIAPRNIR